MTVILAAVALAAVLGTGGCATGGTPIAPGASATGGTPIAPGASVTGGTPMHQGRKLVWSDEFDGNDLDPKKWKFRRTMYGKDCLYANDARTYSVTNGLLRLRVQKSGDSQKKFLLPEGVSTLDTMNYRYGYLEMRGRVPFRHGAWPSFWMQSAARSRTVDWMCETDVFEAFSSTNSLASAGHKWGHGKHCSTGGEKVGGKPFVFKDCSKLNEEFHVYGFEWNPREMKFYVDGVHYQTIFLDAKHDFTTKDGDLVGMGGFHDPEGIIFNNEIFTPGHGWCPKGRELTLADEPFPIEYDIDWVRLWQKPDSEERITYDLAKGGVIPEPEEGFEPLFDATVGTSGWQGSGSYKVLPDSPGILRCIPSADGQADASGGNFCTKKEYGNFVLRFEYCLQKNGNNGLGLRMKKVGDVAAYDGMCEVQLLDDGGSENYDAATKKVRCRTWQLTGAIYGVQPPRLDNALPQAYGKAFAPGGSYAHVAGQWNFMEVRAIGEEIEVWLNGFLINKADLSKWTGDGDTIDRRKHPGLHNRKGFIGWQGHGDPVQWRNVRIKELPDDATMSGYVASGRN